MKRCGLRVKIWILNNKPHPTDYGWNGWDKYNELLTSHDIGFETEKDRESCNKALWEYWCKKFPGRITMETQEYEYER